MWKFQGLIKKEVEFPRGVAKFCGIQPFSFSFVGFCSVKYMVLQQKCWHVIWVNFYFPCTLP